MVSSAASRGQGFVFFAAGAVVLALALRAFARGRRAVLYRYAYLLVLAAAAALAFEGALYLRPTLLRGRLANIAYNGYHWQRGGIYELDGHRGPVLRPRVRRTMYWNGHWWRHESGDEGWRGATVTRADAVFLGDSMIYGHGVEEPETVPARFAARTGRIAVNLGQQGTCQIQSLLTLARHAPRLRPRVVFASLHFTDLAEVARYYDDEELRRFADAPDGSRYEPAVRPEYRPRPWWHPVAFWSRRIALPLRCSGLAGTIARYNRPGARASDHVPRDPFVPTDADLESRLPELEPEGSGAARLPWRAERRAVREMKRLCDGLGARLVRAGPRLSARLRAGDGGAGARGRRSLQRRGATGARAVPGGRKGLPGGRWPLEPGRQRRDRRAAGPRRDDRLGQAASAPAETFDSASRTSPIFW